MTRSRDLANTQANNGGAVPPFAAGKNKIINGDFRINQRAFSSSATDLAYTFDRWMIQALSWATGTVTFSAEIFTPGAAPVSGYEGVNFLRCVTSSLTGSSGYATITQRIEDVRTFAGQTVTMSLWAKAGSGTPSLSLEMVQNFGSGGSTRAPIAASVKKFTLSTSWTRYSFSFTVPSVSGKTIGTGSMLEFFVWYAAGSTYDSRTDSIGIQNGTFDIWGVQVEAGSTATDFQTASGSLGGELALCQRYYYKYISGNSQFIGIGTNYSATAMYVGLNFPVTMRTTPTLSAATGTNYYNFNRDSASDSFDSFTIYQATTNSSGLFNNSNISGTAGHGGIVNTNNASASVAFSAEL